MQDRGAAIQRLEGPCVILAGAGTGKTHTIVEKMKHIAKTGAYDMDKVVCLTFSNEAASDLRRRLLPIITDKEPVIRTFHSFCADLLRQHGDKIGLSKRFSILAPDDAKILMHKNFKVPPRLCHEIVLAIGIAKDLGIDAEEIKGYVESKTLGHDLSAIEKSVTDMQYQLQQLHVQQSKSSEQMGSLRERIDSLLSLMKTHRFWQAWNGYEKLKRQRHSLDYSDLNMNALELLKKNPQISESFQYVIVDEFQDTNKVQCDLLQFLAPHRNITVVGDMNQSIYRFRGAYRRNLSYFSEIFNPEDDDFFALTDSYRSTDTILSIAHRLIAHNAGPDHRSLDVRSVYGDKGAKAQVYELADHKEEVRKILEIIREEARKGTALEDICVLYRTHQQSALLRKALSDARIKYVSVTKASLLSLKVIQTTVACLRILKKMSHNEEQGQRAWWDLVHGSGFSHEDSAVLGRFMKERRAGELSKYMMEGAIGLSKEGIERLEILRTRIRSLLHDRALPVPDLVKKIYQGFGFLAETEQEEGLGQEGREKFLVLQRFVEIAQEYVDSYGDGLAGFLHHLDIISALGIEIPAPQIDEKGVRIMTHHATKGLEFDSVIIASMVQNRFPIMYRKGSLMPVQLLPDIRPHINQSRPGDIEKAAKAFEEINQLLEERRLCYVAMTRAKKRLYMTYALSYGKMNFRPSQFLEEVSYKENELIDFIQDHENRFDEVIASSGIKAKIVAPPSSDERHVFSPSQLNMFLDCQKKYEFAYVYHMPEPEPVSWESVQLGSFVHEVLAKGVSIGLDSEKEFIDLAKAMHMDEKWQAVDIDEALRLVRVFYMRHKDALGKDSYPEHRLSASLHGIPFTGVADRIDVMQGKELAIVDYKTGSSAMDARLRNWQLAYYALAAESSGLGKPRRLILDFLRHERPTEFQLDDHGTAVEMHSRRMKFNVDEMKEEMVSVAQEILACMKDGFSPCPSDKACSFCDQYARGI